MTILAQSYSYGASPLVPTSFSQHLHIYLFGGGQIQQSLSPEINSILFKHALASWTYNLCETTDPERSLEVLHQANCIGASVTMPNKIKFMSLVDDITEEGRAIGAINTIFTRLDPSGKPRRIGTNTDCIGIRETIMISGAGDADITQGQPALVIGAGGASRSAIYALWRWLKPSEIYIVNRLRSEVTDLVSDLEQSMPGIKLRHVETVAEARSIPTPRVIIGTVPSEQPKEPGEVLAWEICDVFLSCRRGKDEPGVVLDMCYHPIRTKLLEVAERQYGWKILFGTEVLVHIVVAQNALWVEKLPSVDAVQEALMAAQLQSTAS